MTQQDIAKEFEALVNESNAIGCEVAGMKAENKWRDQCGQSIAYCEESFSIMAEMYRDIAAKFRNLGESKNS